MNVQTAAPVLLRERDKDVAVLVLNRPAARNSLSEALLAALSAAFSDIAADKSVRAMVLAANGPGFCAGHDLKELTARRSDADRGRAYFTKIMTMCSTMMQQIVTLPQPVIAAVHGYALGGGCELALCCDLIVADETAVFGLPETTVGLVPGGGGTQLAQRKLGPGRAADLIFTGRQVTADEAERIGLADRLAPAGKAGQHALELAQQIAANSPVAIRAAKQAIRHGAGIGLTAALDVEDAAWRKAAMSPDRREGIAAFNEKRPPVWPVR